MNQAGQSKGRQPAAANTRDRWYRVLSCAFLAALVLAAVAYWMPWVDHDAAALKLSGQDLGEFVKFLPSIRRGQARFPRQLFYLPPIAFTLCLVLLVANPELSYPRWMRISMLFLALFPLPGLLPPAWGHPAQLFTSEFRIQGIAFVLGLISVLVHGWLRRISPAVLITMLGILALFALILPQSAFWAIRPRIWAAYDTPTIRLGWGLWLSVVSWIGVIGCAGTFLSSRYKTQQLTDL
jgi:hypothetical protein